MKKEELIKLIQKYEPLLANAVSHMVEYIQDNYSAAYPSKVQTEAVNDYLRRRNPSKYTSQYINRLMSMIPNWKRSDQEKVKGLHPAYCDKTGRTKHPWVRVDTPGEEASTTLLL